MLDCIIVFLIVITFPFAMLFYLFFGEVDSCLDQGGRWDGVEEQCVFES